jgi:hypothetical protein
MASLMGVLSVREGGARVAYWMDEYGHEVEGTNGGHSSSG